MSIVLIISKKYIEQFVIPTSLIVIIYFLTLVNLESLRKKDSSGEFWITEKAPKSSERRRFPQTHGAETDTEPMGTWISNEDSLSKRSNEDGKTKTTPRRASNKRQTPIAETTQYVRAAKKHKKINLKAYPMFPGINLDLAHNHKKNHGTDDASSEYTTNRNVDIPYVSLKHKIGRSEDYVYTLVNTTVHENGKKTHRIIIYNRTHYLHYTGNVVPADYVHLFKLWTELSGAKSFDDEFQPPWWMEWHKPPWWMDWHHPPAKISNDSWDLWNQPGMQPPAPILNPKDNDPLYQNLSGWLRQLYDNINVGINNIKVSSWQRVDTNSPLLNYEDYFAPSRGVVSEDTWTNWNQPASFGGKKYLRFNFFDWIKNFLAKIKNITVSTRKPPAHRLTSTAIKTTTTKKTTTIKTTKTTKKNTVKFRRSQVWENHNINQKVNTYSNKIRQKVINAIASRRQARAPEIKDDKEIIGFTVQILNSTLRLLQNLTEATDESNWKRDIKHIANSYEDKYKEFLIATRYQKIKSDFGRQKVILNAIEMSDRILRRLFNLNIEEEDKVHQIAINFQKAIFDENIRQLDRACSELSICRPGSGIIQLILDVMRLMLTLDDQKFTQAFKSLTETIKSTDFTDHFNVKSDEDIKNIINTFESYATPMQRKAVMIFRNIIIKRNSPLFVFPEVDPSKNGVMMTLALQEIINKVDEKVPNSNENVAVWNRILNDMDSWVREGHPDVQEVMQRLVSNIKYSLNSLDEESYRVVIQNVNKIVS